MDFAKFKQHFQGHPVIFSRDAVRFAENPQVMRNQLSRWQKKGLLLGLRKGVYLLNPQDQRTPPSNLVIANRLYEPSYISLEFALNFYGLIPEAVADLTSVSTRKTMRIKNDVGHFIYQHIQPQAFRGFRQLGQGQNMYFMAEPEKAVVDFLYLNLSQIPGARAGNDVFEQLFRFQNMEDLIPGRLFELGGLFNNKKLLRVLG